ncbi:hypothetical protein P7G58_06005 [Globicatella sulfidifaciens]|uniref:hypothetical protein n=1 Tax=Globicatella sulfidifaciens TaxID=136093 RepID=UPI002891840A|nr:hypothetical protein [Globicatella sulfidifaciens]MDT2768412.1 hypothetical protein [Globicatella sulfidifaciens]
MSGLNLRLKIAENNLAKYNQVIARYLKAQWLSGLNLRLKIAENNLAKYNQVIARYLKAQWLSGLNLRLSTCLRPTQLCGGGQTKRKLFNFLLLAHSQNNIKRWM